MAILGSERAADLGAVLAILAGGLMIAAALARFGFLTELLSKPVRYGYLNGIALAIVVSQLPKLCGFSTDAGTVIEGIRRFAHGVASGEVNGTALAIGLGSIVPDVRDPPLRPAPAWRADRRGRVHRRRRAVRSRRPAPGRPDAPWGAVLPDPGRSRRGLGTAGRWRRQHRHRGLHRHQRALPHVRATGRAPRRRQPRAGSSRHRQPDHRAVPGLRHLHQLDPDPGGRRGRRPHPADRPDGGPRRHRRARGVAGGVQEPAGVHARRRRDRGRHGPGRDTGLGPPGQAAPERAGAVDGGLPRRLPHRRAGGHRARRSASRCSTS